MAEVDHAFKLTEGPRGFDRAKFMRQIAADQRKKDRKKLRELRAKIATVKKRRQAAMKKQVKRCRARRLALREEIKQKRAAERERLNREIQEMRDNARKACALRKQAIKSASLNVEQRRRETLEAERQLQRELRHSEQYAKRRRAEFKRTAAEVQAESDDRVRQNIDAELLPVFNKVRRGIKARPGMSRTEAFLHWVEENPDEVIVIQQEAADVELKRLLREQAKAERTAKPPRRARKKQARADLDEYLAGVPF